MIRTAPTQVTLRQSRSARLSKHGKRCPNRRGATLVEFSICIPIFLTLVFGLVEMARLYNMESATIMATMVAGREAIIADATRLEVEQAAADFLSILQVRESMITVTPAVLTPETPEVTITVELPLKTSNGFVFTNFVGGKKVTHTITRTRELDF